MSFLRRKSSSRAQSEASGSPVELTLPVIEPSHSNGGVFSGSALLGAAAAGAGGAGGGGPTSAVDYKSSKPVSPTRKEDAASEPSSPVRRVSMVPIPRPTSSYSKTKSYNRNNEQPPPPMPGTKADVGLGIQAPPDAPVLANDESTAKTAMTRSVSYPQNAARSAGSRKTIASLYPSPNIGVDFDSFSLLQTPHALANGLGTNGGGGPLRSRMTKSTSTPNFVRRSHRVAPPLNLIVVGAKSTGKTGWIRTFLGNLELGSDARKSRESIRNFGMRDQSSRQGSRRKGKISPTRETQTISVEVIGPHDEKIALTCVDTVALDRSDEEEGAKGMSPPTRGWGALDELKVERQLAKILRIVEERFDETLKAESQVVRPSARSPDSHFHLCLYFVHPDSIRPQVRPTAANGRTTGTSEEGKQGAVNGHEKNRFPEEDEGYDDEMGMTEMDLKCIKKLSQRVHVLPIIARADEMTVSRLEEVKEAVRRDLARSGVSFGAFSSASALSVDEDDEEDDDDDDDDEPTPPTATARPVTTSKTEGEGDSSKVEADEAPVKVIRMARGRLSTLAPSRRRMSAATEVAELEEPIDTPTFDDYLPFAVVAPEEATRVNKGLSQDEDEDENDSEETYERHFRYGSLNVLDPKHCDFTPLKEAIFVKMKTLKETTRLDKYEPFRTKRLLERRKTVKLVGAGGAGAGGANRGMSVRQSLTKDLLREVEEI